MSDIIYILFSAFARITPVPYNPNESLVRELKKWVYSRSLYFLEWLVHLNYPPFTHMELAYFENPEDRHLLSYSLSASDGIYEYKTRFESHRWGFIALRVSKEQKDKIVSLCKGAMSISTKFSLNKILHLEINLRRFFFLSKMSYPSLKQDKFICSEFVITVLQQAGVINFDIHPSYISPSGFFSYLLYYCRDIINMKASVSPFTNKQNAVVLFKEITGLKVPYIALTSSITLDIKPDSFMSEIKTPNKTKPLIKKERRKKKKRQSGTYILDIDPDKPIFML